MVENFRKKRFSTEKTERFVFGENKMWKKSVGNNILFYLKF